MKKQLYIIFFFVLFFSVSIHAQKNFNNETTIFVDTVTNKYREIGCYKIVDSQIKLTGTWKYFDKKSGQLKMTKTFGDTIKIINYRKRNFIMSEYNYFDFKNGLSSKMINISYYKSGKKKYYSYFCEKERNYFAKYRKNGKIKREILIDSTDTLRITNKYSNEGKKLCLSIETKRINKKGESYWLILNPKFKDYIRNNYYLFLIITLVPIIGGIK